MEETSTQQEWLKQSDEVLESDKVHQPTLESSQHLNPSKSD